MNKKALFISLVILLNLNVPLINAYDTDNVHPLINENALKQSNVDQYLKSYLGFNEGIKEFFKSKTVLEWIRDGGKQEDSPDYRSNNHFHDPLKSWNTAGLKGSTLGLSSLIWAQDQSLLGATAGGDWSWTKARNLYYEGLTATDKTTRGQKLADAFRAVGQVMHLIADSSVPAHVRNDIHVMPTYIVGQTYESWAKTNWQGLTYTAKNVDASIFNQAVSNSSAPIPISALWDQDKYNGTNPSVTWITNPTTSEYGISEYTNANFFSDDTIFKDFPHPAKENTTAKLVEQTAKDGKTDKVWYIQGYTSERLAAYSYMNKWLSSDKWEYNLDNYVYKDYASQLIPRAVGYSAGLLNYFFRGTLEITAPDQFIYAVADGSKTPHQFTTIKAKIRNTTSNETIKNGIIQAIAKYKKRTDYRTDLSTDPPDASSRETDFSYSVSSSVTVDSLDSTTATEFTFNFTNSPIPAGITDLYLLIIFKGTLGSETDKAIAIGIKDLMEPTHHVFWNLTDRFALKHYLTDNQYYLHTASDIENTSSLKELVDLNHNGILNEEEEPYISPYNITFDIGYAETSTVDTIYNTATVSLPPGRYTRLIILVDKEIGNYLKVTYSDAIEPTSQYTTEFDGTYYQEDENGEFQTPTPVEIFRTIRQQYSTGIVGCYPVAIDPNTGYHYCPYPTEPEPDDKTPYPADYIYF